MAALQREFYLRDTVTVARELLGKWLVFRGDKRELVAEIIETEAYLGVLDKACHSYGGRRSARTEVMYGPGGFSYVYLIYGMYDLLNVVTEAEGVPCAVLIRGAQPVEGGEQIAKNRFGKEFSQLTPAQKRSLLDGPGKLCRGMGITRQHNGLDLCSDTMFFCEPARAEPFSIRADVRIGIDYAQEAAEWPLRFTKINNL